jgi:hypothetical protein
MALAILSFARQKVLHDALETVRRSTGSVKIRSEASRLLRRNPDCGMTASEIETEVMRHAIVRGMVVVLG